MKYVVKVFGGNNFYTDNLDEAEEVFFNICDEDDVKVQLLMGEHGKYERVIQNFPY